MDRDIRNQLYFLENQPPSGFDVEQAIQGFVDSSKFREGCDVVYADERDGAPYEMFGRTLTGAVEDSQFDTLPFDILRFHRAGILNALTAYAEDEGLTEEEGRAVEAVIINRIFAPRNESDCMGSNVYNPVSGRHVERPDSHRRRFVAWAELAFEAGAYEAAAEWAFAMKEGVAPYHKHMSLMHPVHVVDMEGALESANEFAYRIFKATGIPLFKNTEEIAAQLDALGTASKPEQEQDARGDSGARYRSRIYSRGRAGSQTIDVEWTEHAPSDAKKLQAPPDEGEQASA